MYRRYSQANGNGASLTQMKRSRLKDLLILVLAGLLIVSLVIGIPALQRGNGTRSIYIQRIQTECDEAIRQTSTLSRNAGADSAAILSRIRCNIYTIRALNEVHSKSGGKQLLDDDRLQSIQNTLDRYLSFLTTGMDTGEYQTSLQTSLNELQGIVSNLR